MKQKMQCSGGSCTAGYKSLKSYSDFLTPGQQAACSNVLAYAQTDFGGFPDPYACLQYGFAPDPPYCCAFQFLYTFPNVLFALPKMANAGSVCHNPNFNSNSCQVFGPYSPPSEAGPYTKSFYIACPNAGVIDALTASILGGDSNTQSYGFSLTLQQAYDLVGPYGCYDATPLQQGALYSQTHQVCPNLDLGFSYTSALDAALTQASWSSLSITVPCCARLSQTILTGDSNESCSAQSCFESPQCGELLRSYCSNTINRNDVFCLRWKSWTTNRLFLDNCTTSNNVFPSAGTYPSSMDQAFFSLLDYCAANSVTDPDVCEGLTFAAGLNNNLVFPRVDAITISDIVGEFATAMTIQTLTFSITNRSNIPMKSLTVLTTNTNYTITLQTQTLLPNEKTLVTVSTGLTQALPPDDVYVLSKTLTWVGDSFNVNDDCEAVGTFFPSTNPSSLTVPQNFEYPVADACVSGDEELSFQLFDAGTTTTHFAPVFDSATCASLSDQHSLTLGATVFPSCSCTSPFGCDAGLEGRCHSSTIVSRELSSVRVCNGQGWSTTPMYFADTFSWLPNTLSSLRQDFPIFGGFQVTFGSNPFNFFLTPTLMAFPLTSDLFLE